MLLSIVMMIKNEERHLDRTLGALMPLMNEIDSELIILDTGSTDSSIEIAKKYTDKVYFEKWNDNFGEMRNKSISYSNGEWILILDADEELTNYYKLKDFLCSKLHLKYNSATIILKNIFSQDGKSYSTSPMVRMFKNDGEFRYEGAIHEQPIFKKPIFNGVANFDHYGYLFEDEEVRQLKDYRNKKILLKEIEKNPHNPYINYQLGKQYNISNDYEDAIYYIEKGYEIYESIGYIPIFVTLDLASLYIDLTEFNKCEKLCLKYIKKDNKNIDIYYCLATSQRNLNKHEQSIENYNRYLYLIENYDITTQSNDPECNSDTLMHKNKVYINILDSYYKLEMYNEIVKRLNDLNEDIIEESYLIILMSLYKLNKEQKILDLYKKVSKTIVQENKFKIAMEAILRRIKEPDRVKFYKLLSKFSGNYGTLNKLRLGEKISEEECNKILKSEREIYYADIIYYANRQKLDIEKILKDISYISIQNYIDYIVKNRRDFILDGYKYLENYNNTLDMNKIKIYSCISKSMLNYSNLTGNKYKEIFFMYINCTYEFIKLTYNSQLEDIELIKYLRNSDDEFVVNINRIMKLKDIDKFLYIKELKKLLINNQNYKKCIQMLITELEKEVEENIELKQLKFEYKKIIEKSINEGKINDACKMISEYESMFNEEADILNMKSIICIMNNKLEDAEYLLKKSWLLDNNNFNTIFNIGCLKEIKGDLTESLRFFKLIVSRCKDEQTIAEAKEKINSISI